MGVAAAVKVVHPLHMVALLPAVIVGQVWEKVMDDVRWMMADVKSNLRMGVLV